MNTAKIPFRDVPYLPQTLDVTYRDDGSIILRNGLPLRPHPPHMLAPMVYWGAIDPDRLWLAQRDPVDPSQPGWVKITYGEALSEIRRLAQGLLNMGAGPDTPLMILSRNSVEHGLVMYAALWCGVPVVPVTPAHATLSQDFTRLTFIDELVKPKLIYVDDGDLFQRGLDGMDVGDRPVIYARNAPNCTHPVALHSLLETDPTRAVHLAYDRLNSATVAKYMMTSGSTGTPKAVINSHGMIAANAKMIRSIWDVDRLDALYGDQQQVMLNFLPWSHTYGANAILHSITDWGGALYIDWGNPTPAKLPEMLRNLKDVSPTQHTTVPAAWAAIATALEEDRTLAEVFFSKIMVMAYGGAAMGQDIYERIQAVAVDVTGQRISLAAGYGATETAPTTSNVHWPSDKMGLIGLPVPGCEMKLAPVGEKLECRVRGPHVMPGYLDAAVTTAAAFDDEGYYMLGDAVRFVDPADPNKGLAFDGRIAEEFKLSSGTWVSAGTVRVKAVEAIDGPVSDLVICGLNEDYIAALAFLNEGWCSKHLGHTCTLPDLAVDSTIKALISDRLSTYNQNHPAPSARIRRIALQSTPPLIETGEITEKGYLNQARVRDLRAADVDVLYDGSSSDRMIHL